MDKVEVEILGLSSTSSGGGAYALLLKEVFGVRRLPIIIGTFEAQSIALELEGIKPPRPLTHDLLKSVIDTLGGIVKEVFINDLIDNTFHGKIIIEISGITDEVDSRPSDAIALAVRTKTPIYVAEHVMEQAGIIPSSEEELNRFETEENENEGFKANRESKIAELQDQLRKAIEVEDYERAAKIRDEIKKITGQSN